ncbi:hypothetical protein MRX96_006090 [Rhipicephalus microplus]
MSFLLSPCRYSAEALERISKNLSLQQEVTHLLLVSEAAAAALTRTELKAMQSLDGFTRAAGVVKDGVSCERREDGNIQLEDINEDCWSLIIFHLKLEDVTEPAATALTEDLWHPIIASALVTNKKTHAKTAFSKMTPILG